MLPREFSEHGHQESKFELRVSLIFTVFSLHYLHRLTLRDKHCLFLLPLQTLATYYDSVRGATG